jgi:hypothetical protein
MAAANEELGQLVTNQARDLLAQIRKDIEGSSTLTDDDRKNCEAICQRVETEHKRLKSEFLRESLNLIDQALATSDQQRLKQIHQTWSWALDNVTRQCKSLAGPLIELLEVLSRRDANLKKKYAAFLTGAVVSSILAGAAVVVLAFHSHPGCAFQLAAEAVALVAGGSLIAIAIAFGFITGCISTARLRSVYQKCSDSVRLILVKFFPDCFNNSSKDPSNSDLATVIKDGIDTLNIKEDMWQNSIALASIKRAAENQLRNLQENR